MNEKKFLFFHGIEQCDAVSINDDSNDDSVQDQDYLSTLECKGRTRFTKMEERHLLDGVKLHGAGNWAKILECYEFNPTRTNVSLKDKFRVLNQGKSWENKNRKSRVRFSKREVENLLEGVKRFGVGKWAKIANHYEFHESRTNVHLKDKYRTMKSQGKL